MTKQTFNQDILIKTRTINNKTIKHLIGTINKVA